jgi:hypothetical protein
MRIQRVFLDVFDLGQADVETVFRPIDGRGKYFSAGQ